MRTCSRRRTRSELQCNQCSRVVHVGQGNCSFPVNEDEKDKGEEEEEREEVEED